ncbi:hypothetical protein MPER_06198, partial [Moniliophthora perniciosa FA553]
GPSGQARTEPVVSGNDLDVETVAPEWENILVSLQDPPNEPEPPYPSVDSTTTYCSNSSLQPLQHRQLLNYASSEDWSAEMETKPRVPVPVPKSRKLKRNGTGFSKT